MLNRLKSIQGVVLAMSDQEAKINSIQRLRERGFEGIIVANCSEEADLERMLKAGASKVHLMMKESGISLAQEIMAART